MNRKALLILLVNIIACNVKAQTSDYIVKDSAQIFGKISLVKDKVQIQRSRADNPILYSAGEVSVFSLSGDIYKSLPYKGERYFFKETVNGDVSLYRWGREFAVVVKDSGILLSRDSFHESLQRYNTCRDMSSFPDISYRKPQLKTAVRWLNNDPCKLQYFTKPRFGIVVGGGQMSVTVSTSRFSEIKKPKPFVPVGIFAEFPIYPLNGLSFIAEVDYVNSGYTEFFGEGTASVTYFDVKTEGIVVPIGFKFTANKINLKPYIKAAPMFSYLQLASRTDITFGTENNGVLIFSQKEFNEKSISPFGFMGAAGVHIPVNKSHSIHVEGRYLKVSDTYLNGIQFGFSGASLSLGYNF